MRRRGVGDGEGRKVHAAVARETCVELAAERRVRGLEQHLDIAAREHGGDIAGAGTLRRAAGRIGINLNGDGRGGEARPRERAARRIGIAYEMADMVEENLVLDR